MTVPHGPQGVGRARRRMREELRGSLVPEPVVDDAVLVLSELLSNACRHGRPLDEAPEGQVPEGEGEEDGGPEDDGLVRAAWQVEGGGRLTVEVTDGGGPTRPRPSHPSLTAHGGRGLSIIAALSHDWGVRDHARGGITVWAVVHAGAVDGSGDSRSTRHRQEDFAARVVAPSAGLAALGEEFPGLAAFKGMADGDLDELEALPDGAHGPDGARGPAASGEGFGDLAGLG